MAGASAATGVLLRPRRIVVVDALPTNAAGKVVSRELIAGLD